MSSISKQIRKKLKDIVPAAIEKKEKVSLLSPQDIKHLKTILSEIPVHSTPQFDFFCKREEAEWSAENAMIPLLPPLLAGMITDKCLDGTVLWNFEYDGEEGILWTQEERDYLYLFETIGISLEDLSPDELRYWRTYAERHLSKGVSRGVLMDFIARNA